MRQAAIANWAFARCVPTPPRRTVSTPNHEEAPMPRFLIERDLPGAGELTPDELSRLNAA